MESTWRTPPCHLGFTWRIARFSRRKRQIPIQGEDRHSHSLPAPESRLHLPPFSVFEVTSLWCEASPPDSRLLQNPIPCSAPSLRNSLSSYCVRISTSSRGRALKSPFPVCLARGEELDGHTLVHERRKGSTALAQTAARSNLPLLFLPKPPLPFLCHRITAKTRPQPRSIGFPFTSCSPEDPHGCHAGTASPCLGASNGSA